MRWETRQAGVRTRRRFLVWPKTIGNLTRWWEFAMWEERYHRGVTMSWWEARRWLDI